MLKYQITETLLILLHFPAVSWQESISQHLSQLINSSISSSRINVLFLDEVNQALDEQGKEKVVEVLLKEDDLNTYLVSHGWTHPLLEKIEIIKENNISCLSL